MQPGAEQTDPAPLLETRGNAAISHTNEGEEWRGRFQTGHSQDGSQRQQAQEGTSEWHPECQTRLKSVLGKGNCESPKAGSSWACLTPAWPEQRDRR
jgi:hypothetical protein